MPSAKKNPAASALGKLAKDKRKTLTPAALKQRRKASQNAAKARKRRQKQKAQRAAAAHADAHYNDAE